MKHLIDLMKSHDSPLQETGAISSPGKAGSGLVSFFNSQSEKLEIIPYYSATFFKEGGGKKHVDPGVI